MKCFVNSVAKRQVFLEDGLKNLFQSGRRRLRKNFRVAKKKSLRKFRVIIVMGKIFSAVQTMRQN